MCVSDLRHSQPQSTSRNLQEHVTPPDLAGHHAAGTHPWVRCSCWALSQQRQSPSQRGSLQACFSSTGFGFTQESADLMLFGPGLIIDSKLFAHCLKDRFPFSCILHSSSAVTRFVPKDKRRSGLDRSLNRKEQGKKVLAAHLIINFCS